MDLMSVSIGTIFWASLAFLIVLFLLKKMAWKPILDGLSAREKSIAEALESAKEAKEEMARLQASNEDLLKEARMEREALLKEAREMKNSIVAKAETEAKGKADGIVKKAMADIEQEKKAAMSELKTQVAEFSLQIAEKVVKKKLDSATEQMELVDSLMGDLKLN
ncbi:MAG: F-type H+-transporting ATPase subunit b [Patiriisocius sp.]|jgi:F-type H+-transporting ATPase subunit b